MRKVYDGDITGTVREGEEGEEEVGLVNAFHVSAAEGSWEGLCWIRGFRSYRNIESWRQKIDYNNDHFSVWNTK